MQAMLTRLGTREVILVMKRRPGALDQEDAEPSVWRLICRWLQTRVNARFAGVVLGLLNLDSGDLLVWRPLNGNRQKTSKRLKNKSAPESQSGVVLQRRDESTMKKHLLLNAERLTNWADFRAEGIHVRRAQQIVHSQWTSVRLMSRAKARWAKDKVPRVPVQTWCVANADVRDT